MPRRKPRRRAHWVAYLWPGLPHLWVRGSAAGLTLAVAFSVLVNVLVLATLVWPTWLESRLKFGCAIAAAALWVAAVRETHRELRRLARERTTAGDDEEKTVANSGPNEQENDSTTNDLLLRSAQQSYLRGDWVAAERGLREAIRRDHDDFEARLWLVSVLRVSGRERAAQRLLERVARRDAARGWRCEVEQERRRLKRLVTPNHSSRPAANPTQSPRDRKAA